MQGAQRTRKECGTHCLKGMVPIWHRLGSPVSQGGRVCDDAATRKTRPLTNRHQLPHREDTTCLHACHRS